MTEKTIKTVVIGLGNPILSDDSVGIRVSREVRERLKCGQGSGSAADNVDVKELYAGGIRLMDAITGYDKAVIVDAMVTGRFRPGEVCELSAADLCPTRNILCTHDTNLNTALEFGRMMELHLPHDIQIFGIEAVDVTSFSETLTNDVRPAVSVAADAILKKLDENSDREAA